MAQRRRAQTQSAFARRGQVLRRTSDFCVSRLCGLERRPTRSGDETKGLDRAKAESGGVKIGNAFTALVRHHEPARTLVSNARRRAGRSVIKLVTSDRWRVTSKESRNR